MSAKSPPHEELFHNSCSRDEENTGCDCCSRSGSDAQGIQHTCDVTVFSQTPQRTSHEPPGQSCSQLSVNNWLQKEVTPPDISLFLRVLSTTNKPQ